MERRVRRKSHARCGAGEKAEIISKPYLSLWISGAIALTAFLNFDVRSLWGLFVAVIFFSVALATGKIGGGDVKLIAALSVVCGLWGSFALLLFAQIAMLIFYTIKFIIFKIRGKTADKALPFVPFIFIGYLCSKLIF